MKSLASTVVAFLLVASPGNAGIIGWLSQEHQDWKFIQSVGGMKVRLARKMLAVSCDVSGLHQMTTQPTAGNSGIGVRKLGWTRAGAAIRLSVVTGVFEKGMSTSCGMIDLSDVPSGTYSVEYLDPDGTTHPLSRVVLRD